MTAAARAACCGCAVALCLTAAARVQEPASLTLTLARLADANRNIRLDAVRELTMTRREGDTAEAAVMALEGAALLDADAQVRAEALTALSELQGTNLSQLLAQAVLDLDVDVRRAAVAAVDAESDYAIAILSVAIADVSPSVREDAMYKLSEIGGPGALALLEQRLGDPDAAVRSAAVVLTTELRREARRGNPAR